MSNYLLEKRCLPASTDAQLRRRPKTVVKSTSAFACFGANRKLAKAIDARGAAAAKYMAVGCGAGAPLPRAKGGGQHKGAAARRPSVCVHRLAWVGRCAGGHDTRS